MARRKKIKELLSYALVKNTSIKKIHLKQSSSPCIFQFVNLVKHCQQLETVVFKWQIFSEKIVSHVIMQLHVKHLILQDCCMTPKCA